MSEVEELKQQVEELKSQVMFLARMLHEARCIDGYPVLSGSCKEIKQLEGIARGSND